MLLQLLSLMLVAVLAGAAGCWLCRCHRQPSPASATPAGLPDQATILQALTRTLSLADRLRHPVTLLLVEIDGFAALQNRGASVAAAAEARVAEWLKQRVRAHDLLGHWDPGQFLAVLPDADVASALVLAEDMRQLVLRRPRVTSGADAPPLTVSIGVHGRTPTAEHPLHDLAPDMVVGALRALEATTGDGPSRIEIEP